LPGDIFILVGLGRWPPGFRRRTMGALRDRMVEDLTLRGMSPLTMAVYLRYAQLFVNHHGGVSPLRLGEGAVRAFLLHRVKEEGVSPSTQRLCVTSLKFLYGVTLKRPQVVARIPYPKVPRSPTY
jgi:integrase/recombinase XerD